MARGKVAAFIATIMIGAGLTVSDAGAEGKLTIALMDIEGLFQADGQGLYDQLLSAAMGLEKNLFSFQILPPKRALYAFTKGQYDCITPANTSPYFYQFKFSTILSEALSEAQIYIFTAAGSKPISNLEALRGKRVGMRRGFPLGREADQAGLKIMQAESYETSIKELEQGRIVAFLAYKPDIDVVFAKLNMKPLPHVADKPIATHQDSVLCQGSESGLKAVSIINRGLKEMQKDGSFEAIMRNHSEKWFR